MQTPAAEPVDPRDEGAETMSGRSARERLRIVKDKLFAGIMGVGGVAVIVAIMLIFAYLFYVVVPLFKGAEITPGVTAAYRASSPVAHAALDEYTEIGLDVRADGSYSFFAAGDGRVIDSGHLLGAASADVAVTSIAAGDPAAHTLFAGTGDGRAVVARADYSISYPDDRRVVTPRLSRAFEGALVEVDERGQALTLLAGQSSDDETTLAAVTADGRVLVVGVTSETSFLDDEVTLTRVTSEIDGNGAAVTHLALDVDQRELYLVTDDGAVSLYDVRDKENVRFVDRAPAVAEGATVTALEFLSGGISVLIGDDRGGLAQWFPVRDDNNVYTLARVRDFPPMSAAVVHIAPEYFRKAFAALDADGQLALFHTTAGRRILLHETGADEVSAFAMAPRANAAIVAGADGEFSSFRIDNEHPEVSFQALWQEVWYENRQEPEYIWQSSSASSDFEPKFSLTPLTFGTLKATFYSMLFAVPLAVLGAVYTAYFMTPFMRAVVKPSVEVMAALPTVILGFLAGLWLAPLVERELLGLILGVAVVPLGILLACWLYTRLPRRWRELVPDGWEALMLIPVIIVMTWVSLSAGSLAEVWFFGGSLPQWLTQNYGITYDQRNSLVVGIAIGFAVIPTIFSISEDAVFSVPRSLTMGSLALGATPWQTAVRVILLTASPGIFSAVMIGMGRAVGETMIVLMATGNTPIMDLNIFQGFRALSANIAVEMPESEVDSTHYRILFLAALVLFMVTFLVNTLAELVRQRLRRKYASL